MRRITPAAFRAFTCPTIPSELEPAWLVLAESVPSSKPSPRMCEWAPMRSVFVISRTDALFVDIVVACNERRRSGTVSTLGFLADALQHKNHPHHSASRLPDSSSWLETICRSIGIFDFLVLTDCHRFAVKVGKAGIEPSE